MHSSELPVAAADLGSGGFSALFRVGAVAALATALITVIQIVVCILWPPLSYAPAAGEVRAWLELLQRDPLVGLLGLDILMVADYVLLFLVYLAFYAVLRKTNPSLMTIGTGLALMGIVLYFTTNPALSMLALSRQYAGTDVAGQATCVAAGQAIMAQSEGTSFDVSYVLMGAAGITVSMAMLRSAVFSRTTAVVGILQGGLMLVPSNAGRIGLVFAFASLLPFVIWFILAALRLLELSRQP